MRIGQGSCDCSERAETANSERSRCAECVAFAHLRTIEGGKRECIATVEAAPGSALCIALDEVAEVRPSRKSFEYFQ